MECLYVECIDTQERHVEKTVKIDMTSSDLGSHYFEGWQFIALQLEDKSETIISLN
ncbi:hypothetical protein GCM10011502_14180 [Oceanisphaera marina]|uniref:Uncharacterized protein n=1 Tax=Oceanisphaera marina TaxID=2017550 RepID=A0ABQ1IJ90_9GAMM|nr:hypothetical protein GCM10011502_14180 [Oceanisphaera marina]